MEDSLIKELNEYNHVELHLMLRDKEVIRKAQKAFNQIREKAINEDHARTHGLSDRIEKYNDWQLINVKSK